MKKYIKLITLTAMTLFYSCQDFLDERQVSNLTQDYFNDENGLESLINGLYVYARVKHEWEANGARLTLAETDAYMTSAPAWARMEVGVYGNDLSNIANNMFNYLGNANASFAPMGAYPHINNCNIALDVLENIAPGVFGTNQSFANQRKAEILFLRSWAFYLVSNQLGDIPLLLTPRRQDDGIYYYPKSSMEDVYNQMITDLTFAYDNLPTSSARGRVTKWAAGHFLAKLYLNRAQGAEFQNSSEESLRMLYKGTNANDLDNAIAISTEVINGVGGLAPDYWTLFDPAVSESNPHPEVLWAAQFDTNIGLNGRFGGNRSVNYHIGNYTEQSGVNRSMIYGRPFGTFKPTDHGYDNFKDKMHDSRYAKTFQHEYIGNMGSNTTSFRWTDATAAWWNANKPADQPEVRSGDIRIQNGRRAIIYLENDKENALDSMEVMSQPFQFLVRWVRSAATGNYYYRLFINGANLGLATQTAPYLSVKKFTDPTRGGSTDESNFNSENGTRDAILMRLAETYLIRAEAYGRRGDYASAVADINVLRQRAAFKGGENRPSSIVQWYPEANELDNSELEAPYAALGDSYDRIMVTENHFTPGTIEANREGYIPTVSTKRDMFIHFIYNEKNREFLGEGIMWEDLHNAGILYDRVMHFNQMASNRTGLWPVAANTAGGNGQNGNGKGQMQRFHTFRPWPFNYLIQLTDQNGQPLDQTARNEYQNPGY
ncbi:RagB/SusD family nutrient uptake outer membrane protein [Belliella kenyensis]|uniref:RagB/SusD family nutrient uptake outer membrane protein n=1 Tax=Belliella kenyensis TaxID=1472724 RepID=A0ABV8EGA5_9BACT|nr:RagB/SusD family nutrient uptake outer membrane protein [Belliella kenyensis]MCH7401864.1 RagB/SusD family nutrient uptake outer membrane protein [Belliella kenyensis]MDN3604364.1 RagB/SusD family nutrient uptake outer membrane protein [Belliella kenyensis]